VSTRLPTLLAALRARVDGTAGLPAGRAWANASYTPTPGVGYVSDTLELADTRPHELGATGRGRTEALYTVRVHVPAGTAAIAALTHAGALVDAMRAAVPPMTVNGEPVRVSEARVETPLQLEPWYVVPISVFLQFDHP
jgi:urease alpha subunit